MRGVTLPVLPSRIKGRQHLINRLRRLVLISYRYARGRARTRAERYWVARLIDGLEATLKAVEDPNVVSRDASRSDGPLADLDARAGVQLARNSCLCDADLQGEVDVQS